MTILLDPEESETRALLELAGPFAGKRVLEVGSGDGRLTWRYAAGAARVLGLEPEPARFGRAQPAAPVAFRNESLEAYAAAHPEAAGSFDLALLSWSL